MLGMYAFDMKMFWFSVKNMLNKINDNEETEDGETGYLRKQMQEDPRGYGA